MTVNIFPEAINKIDYISGNSGIDASTESLVVVDYPHHEIHDGNHFYVKNYDDLALNNVIDMQITSPNTTKWPHLEVFFICESEYNFWLYEGVTVNVAGTQQTAINRNRNSSTVAGMDVKIISNTSIANANSDTDISGATTLATGKVGSGVRMGGEGSSRLEIVLKQNTVYSMRFEAVSAGYIDFLLDWYEHTDKN